MRTCIVQILDARIVCDGEWGVAEGLVFDNFEVKEFDWLKVFKRTQEKLTEAISGLLTIQLH